MLSLASFPNQTSDYNPIATRINAFKDADAVLLANTVPPAASVYAGIDYIKKHYPKVKNVVVVNSDDGSLPYLVPKLKKALKDAGITTLGAGLVVVLLLVRPRGFFGHEA